jgi:hypothetical protein
MVLDPHEDVLTAVRGPDRDGAASVDPGVDKEVLEHFSELGGPTVCHEIRWHGRHDLRALRAGKINLRPDDVGQTE